MRGWPGRGGPAGWGTAVAGQRRRFIPAAVDLPCLLPLTSPLPPSLPPPPPGAGWLFKKLWGRLPADVDRASCYDPDLGFTYTFDVSFTPAGAPPGNQRAATLPALRLLLLERAVLVECSGVLLACHALHPPAHAVADSPAATRSPALPPAPAPPANVHYFQGRTYSAWMRECGLQAGEQIRLKRDGTRVLIQRVPVDRRVRAVPGQGAVAGQAGWQGRQSRGWAGTRLARPLG